MRGDRGHLDLLAGHRRPRLAGGGGDERLPPRSRPRLPPRARAPIRSSSTCSSRLGQHAAHRNPAYGVGALRLGQWLRFIPYPVVGGFLAASGILLTGGIEVVTQTDLTLLPSSWALLYRSSTGRRFSSPFCLRRPFLSLRDGCPPTLRSRSSSSPFSLASTPACSAPSATPASAAWFCRNSASSSRGGPQRHGRGPGRLGRDRAEQRRDRVLLRRHGDRAFCSTSRASKSRARNPATSIRSSARTVLPICSPRCSAASADRCR